MRVLCFLLLAARAKSLPQESATIDDTAEYQASNVTTTFPSTAEDDFAIDNDVFDALEQELIKNNITLTRDADIPKDIAQVADHYDRLQDSISRSQDEAPSLRKGGQAAFTAFGVGSIVSLAKVALVMIALNSGPREASVVMSNGVTGTLKFRQAAAPFGNTSITGTLTGLPEGIHGFHIHDFGNLTDACTATGGHYNPYRATHGGPTNSTRHVGDLGNIVAFANKTAFVNIIDSQVLLVGPTSVIGRAVVVRAKADDLGQGGHEFSSVNGNSGLPVGCGIIGHA